MKQYETTKLFYDRYKYKLVILNELGQIFRHKNMARARLLLDSLQYQQDTGESLQILSNIFWRQAVTPEVFLENKRFYKEFDKAVDYKVRIERTMMSIYSNDLVWIKTLSKIAESPIEIWKPRESCEQLIEEPHVILTRTPTEFNYKVTLSSTHPVDPGLANWIRANPDKAKASEKCLGVIERRGYPRGQHIYIRDEKILNLVSFMIDKLGRVDKLVYVDDEDK